MRRLYFFLVEMAGIEPASERLVPRTSTSVACRLSYREVLNKPGNLPASCWDPRVPLRRTSQHRAPHTDFMPPALPSVSERGRQAWPFYRPLLILSHLCSEGQSSVSICAIGTLFCTDFTSSAPLGSQSGASLLRRSLSSPDTHIIQQKLT